MAETTTKAGGLLNKIKRNLGGLIEEAAAAPEREPNSGFQKLPGGIPNGIARLISCELLEYDAKTNAKTAKGVKATGELYVKMVGECLQPKVHQTPEGPVKTLFQKTTIFFNLFDTKSQAGNVTTKKENFDEMVNMMRLLSPEGSGYMDDMTEENLEEKMAGLSQMALNEQGKPCGLFFKFATQFGKPKMGPDGQPTGEPLPVFEKWFGNRVVPEDFVPDFSGVAEDETAEETVISKPKQGKVSTNGATTGRIQTAKPNVSALPKTPTKAAETITFSEFGDLDSLAKKADKKPSDKEAAKKIKAAAEEAGVEWAKVDTWTDVVALIKAQAEGGTEQAEEGEAFTPEEGGTAVWKPLDKNGEPTGEEINVEILKLNDRMGWANCKSLDDGETVYEKVDVIELHPSE